MLKFNNKMDILPMSDTITKDSIYHLHKQSDYHNLKFKDD